LPLEVTTRARPDPAAAGPAGGGRVGAGAGGDFKRQGVALFALLCRMNGAEPGRGPVDQPSTAPGPSGTVPQTPAPPTMVDDGN
ncbi:MAG TPA: hypothetical protein VM263_03220, partial [Acidimicrobiales bacterium]|nr:hypothetical protein [Acidimicrobiales bacterium]